MLFRSEIFYQAQIEMLKDPLKAAEQMKSFFKNNPQDFASSFTEVHFIGKSESALLMNKNNTNSVVHKYNKIITNFLEERGQAREKDLDKDIMTSEFVE